MDPEPQVFAPPENGSVIICTGPDSGPSKNKQIK